MKTNSALIRDYLYVYLLILPIVARWIFLESWEIELTISLYEYPLFIPELSFLLLPFFYTKGGERYKKIALIAAIGLVYQLLTCIINPISTPYLNFLGGSDFFITVIIVSMFPPAQRHLRIIKWPVFLVFVLIGLEVILFSLNIIGYSAIEDSRQYGSIMRIQTTIGSATGTSIVLFMLGAVAYYLFAGKKYIQFFILLLGTVTIAFTFSRGALFAQIIFLLYLVFRDARLLSVRKTVQLIGIIAAFILSFYYVGQRMGLVEGIAERMEYTMNRGDISSGRTDRWLLTLDYYAQSPIFGNGSCYMTPYVRAEGLEVDTLDAFSPHNTYLLCLVDYGMVGLIIMISILYGFWMIAYKGRSLHSLHVAFLLVLFGLMNIETVFFIMDIVFLFFLMALISKHDPLINEPNTDS